MYTIFINGREYSSLYRSSSREAVNVYANSVKAANKGKRVEVKSMEYRKILFGGYYFN